MISEQGGGSGDASSGRTKRIIIACGITVGVGIVLFALSALFILKRRQSRRALVNNTELRGKYI